jgi:hypothetical protein
VAIGARPAGKLEFELDVGDVAPLKKGFLDGVAFGMAADGAVALVGGEGRGGSLGPARDEVCALEWRIVLFGHFHYSFWGRLNCCGPSIDASTLREEKGGGVGVDKY